MTKRGIVYLVGAGPGDRDLITLRGIKCLRRADLILYDYLVNPEILEHASESAERICLGRHGEPRWTQQAICERMVVAARNGLTVVRLKSGDPMIFGRVAEELQALSEAAIRFEVVPGITAAIAAASYLGLPITSRETASAVALITGQEASDKNPADQLDYDALARFPGTLIFYMGVTTVSHWTSRLIQAGVPGDRPVALIRRCTWPDQRIIRCRLDEVVEQVTPRSKLPPPVIAVVGDVAEAALTWNWFAQRPLVGQNVLVTRPRHQAAELGESLRELGAHVLYQPALEILDPPNWNAVDQEIDQMSSWDWLVFSSANGVEGLLKRIFQRGLDLRALHGPRLAAVGPGTSQVLRQYKLNDIEQPQDGFRAESLVERLRDRVTGRRVLLVRTNRGRDVLAEGLRAGGATVRELVTYESRDILACDPEVAAKIRSLSRLWVLATSSASALSLVKMLRDEAPPHISQTQEIDADTDAAQGVKLRWITISSITTTALRGCGVEPSAEALEATNESLLDALVRAVEMESPSKS